ncbi:Protein kinase domain [Dillenia turbinata]|uniref:Receptor-like serine/threonine-protein kinase n=1 Tax=Dillenia turbinata TaxID=194707 RepID=A0AAN8ZJ39_9MAGN
MNLHQTMTVQFLFIILIFLFTSVSADISPGSTLRASNPNINWTSPDGTVSLGFIPISSSNPTSYSLSISYSSIPIWSAGGPSTEVDSNSVLQFTASGNLQLLNGSDYVIWQSNTSNLNISSASLKDTGEFVLLRNGNISAWSTFENPTDTILPSQNFTLGKTLSSGLYSFSLLRSGNLTLTWNDSIVYWTMGLNSSVNVTLTSPSLGFQSIGILSLYDQRLSVPYIMAYSSDYAEGSDILRFVKLDSDGNLRMYSSAEGTGTMSETWSAVSDQCRVFGYCGNLGVCSYNDSSPVCGCPSENFKFVDPRDRRKGCTRIKNIEDCPGTATMLQLDHALFLTYDAELSSQVFFAGSAACRFNCLVGDNCQASTSLSDGTGRCYLKASDFVSGYQSAALPSTSFVKVCSPAEPNPPPDQGNLRGSDWKLHPWVVPVVILATLVTLVALEAGMWVWCCRNSPKFGGLSAQYALLEYASGAPVQFSYKELQRATKGFKEKLGEGGFGAVYRGILANRTVVAVKQLEGIEQGEKQFRMEVATISSTHHLNLVRLIGFCSEGRHRLLVYEFMKNGSLDNFLFVTEEQSGKFLDWEHRFNIALATARGITYLHEECRDCIVHCDIKPENILLDENYNAKVSDFGLAKLINPKDHRYRTLTSVRGTRGYLAPEWLANLPMTSKSDVYSYGMVLLEIVSGRRNFEACPETKRKRFSVWAYEEFDKGNVERIVDRRLLDDSVDMEQATRVIQVSFWCIQEQPSQRPMMGKVVQMLEGIMEIERPPAPKPFTEGSASGTSINMSSNASAFSTNTTSLPVPSSSSSLQTAELEGASSSLLRSELM